MASFILAARAAGANGRVLTHCRIIRLWFLAIAGTFDELTDRANRQELRIAKQLLRCRVGDL